MDKNKLEYRMYGAVPYQLSGIQSGIQYGHAVIEYSNHYGDTEEYQKWSKIDKTFIVLNGGTTNFYLERLGSLNQMAYSLETDFSLKVARFHEPDLGDQLTGIAFLVDERVWNREKYPDYDGPWMSNNNVSFPDETYYSYWLKTISPITDEALLIIKLRNYLKNFKLAS